MIIPANSLPEWVTVAEAAQLANRKPRSIYRWIDQDVIAHKVIGGVTYVLAKAAVRLGETTTRGRPKQN